MWFGGFTFYTAVVVPIGTDVLGSSRTQGFVTQQVTNTLNFIGGFALAAMLLDLFLNGKRRSPLMTKWIAVLVTLILALWITLLVVHPMLDSLLEPEHEYVTDEGRFYQTHRIYLWASTIQWVCCWVWLTLLIKDWSRPEPPG